MARFNLKLILLPAVSFLCLSSGLALSEEKTTVGIPQLYKDTAKLITEKKDLKKILKEGADPKELATLVEELGTWRATREKFCPDKDYPVYAKLDTEIDKIVVDFKKVLGERNPKTSEEFQKSVAQLSVLSKSLLGEKSPAFKASNITEDQKALNKKLVENSAKLAELLKVEIKSDLELVSALQEIVTDAKKDTFKVCLMKEKTETTPNPNPGNSTQPAPDTLKEMMARFMKIPGEVGNMIQESAKQMTENMAKFKADMSAQREADRRREEERLAALEQRLQQHSIEDEQPRDEEFRRPFAREPREDEGGNEGSQSSPPSAGGGSPTPQTQPQQDNGSQQLAQKAAQDAAQAQQAAGAALNGAQQAYMAAANAQNQGSLAGLNNNSSSAADRRAFESEQNRKKDEAVAFFQSQSELYKADAEERREQREFDREMTLLNYQAQMAQQQQQGYYGNPSYGGQQQQPFFGNQPYAATATRANTVRNAASGNTSQVGRMGTPVTRRAVR